MKKAFSEVIFSQTYRTGTVKNSQREFKKAFSRKSTQQTIKLCRRIIKNPQARKQTIAFIKAADGKKIRNTSGV